jgi:hypothetical protein
MDVIDILTDIDESLVQWTIHATPKPNGDGVNEMKEVVALRTELDQEINAIVLNRLRVSTLQLENEIAQLQKVDDGLKSAAKTVDTVKDVIGWASTALSLATHIVELAQ